MIYGKYRFNDKDKAVVLVKEFDINQTNHIISTIKTEFIINDDRYEPTGFFLVDVVWVGLDDHPKEWVPFELNLNTNGSVMNIANISYLENKK